MSKQEEGIMQGNFGPWKERFNDLGEKTRELFSREGGDSAMTSVRQFFDSRKAELEDFYGSQNMNQRREDMKQWVEDMRKKMADTGADRKEETQKFFHELNEYLEKHYNSQGEAVEAKA